VLDDVEAALQEAEPAVSVGQLLEQCRNVVREAGQLVDKGRDKQVDEEGDAEQGDRERDADRAPTPKTAPLEHLHERVSAIARTMATTSWMRMPRAAYASASSRTPPTETATSATSVRGAMTTGAGAARAADADASGRRVEGWRGVSVGRDASMAPTFFCPRAGPIS
jgi:hypothetical protein